MKILLIAPPHSNSVRFPVDELVLMAHKYRCEPPLGLWSLGSGLMQSSTQCEVEIFDINLRVLQEYLKGNMSPDLWKELLVQKLMKTQPQIIGITCMFSPAITFCEEISRIAREVVPDSIIILGGGGVAVSISKFENNRDVNYFVLSEGENILEEIIVGSAGNNVFGKIMQTPHRDYLDDLDYLPMLDPTLIQFPDYAATGRVAGLGNFSETAIPYETSRGCPFSCSFCSAHIVWGRRIRYKSIGRIERELDGISKKLAFRNLYLQDDTPFIKKDRTLSLLELFKKRGIVPHFPNSLNVNALDEEIICAFEACGVLNINLAIESCSEDTLKNRMKKNVDLKHARRIIDFTRDKTNIRVTANILLGFPGEKLDDINDSLATLKFLRLDWINFGTVTPLPGSEIYDLVSKKGYLASTPENINFETCCLSTEDFTSQQITSIIETANIEFNFRNNVNLNEKKYARARDSFEYILSIAPHHLEAKEALLKCN